ncbi:MAG: hypothetical protein P8184_18735 [Calditrichia bacterium]
MRLKYFIIPLLVLLALSDISFAQGEAGGFLRRNEMSVGASFRTWSSANNERISEWILPVVYILPLNNRLTFDLMNAPTFASLNTASAGLRGLTDTRIRASYLMMEEKLLLTAGLSLPTGNSRLEAEEWVVASALSMNALDFAVPSLGQGLDLKLSAAYAQQVGGIVLGGGFGYLRKGSFKPFAENEYDYNPGDEITFSLGGDKNIPFGINNLRISGDMTYTIYGNDVFNNQEVFRSGNKLLLEVRSLYKSQPYNLLLYLRNRSKGKNQRGLGSLADEALNSNGNQLETGGIGYFPLNDRLQVKALLDGRIYSRNEDKSNGAAILGIGSGLVYTLSERMLLDSQLKFLKGSLKNKSGSLGVTGFEIGASLQFKL